MFNSLNYRLINSTISLDSDTISTNIFASYVIKYSLHASAHKNYPC